MGAIVVLVIGGLIFLGCLAAAFLGTDRETRGVGGGGAVASGLITLIILGIMSFTVIGANEIGIQTTFGKVNGVVNSGGHLLAPWSSVERFSTRTQVLDMSNKDGSSDSPTVAVKFQGNSGGNVSTTTRWRIENNEAATNLYRSYRSFDSVQSQLVSSVVRDQLNETFAQYSPTDATNGLNRDKINASLIKGLNANDGLLKANGITIESISLQGIDPDQATQDRINRGVQLQADIENAKAEQEKAKIDNETNALRQQSLTPQALTQTCLDIVKSATDRNAPLPGTFNCGMGPGVVGTLPVG